MNGWGHFWVSLWAVPDYKNAHNYWSLATTSQKGSLQGPLSPHRSATFAPFLPLCAHCQMRCIVPGMLSPSQPSSSQPSPAQSLMMGPSVFETRGHQDGPFCKGNLRAPRVPRTILFTDIQILQAQHSPSQPSPAQLSPSQPSSTQPSPTQLSPAHHMPAQPSHHSPAQHIPTQPSPAQPITAQPNPEGPCENIAAEHLNH